MAETTGIAYVHHTRNFWAGCTKVGPGCDGCYAEAFNRWTQGKNELTGEAKNWGPGAPRKPYLEGAAKDLRKWNSQSCAMGIRHRVFINTFSDTFDNEIPGAWRDFMWPVLEECGWLDFLLVTKRVGNVFKMVPARWMDNGFPANVRVIATIVNQEEADRDIEKLLALPCKNGISCEPQLGEIDWSPWLWPMHWHWDSRFKTPEDAIAAGAYAQRKPQGLVLASRKFIEWIIVGGESDQPGHITRPFVLGWAKSSVRQCKEYGVPVFVKQLGSRPTNREGEPHPLKHPKGEDPSEWPEELQVQEVP